MEKKQKEFAEIVSDAMARIKQLPGWRKEFASRFNKSNATISNWKSGKTKPSEEDKLHFLEVVTGIARDLGANRKKLIDRKERAMEEYSQLFD